MDKTEKRYFRQFARARHINQERKKYLRLFETIARQKNQNERVLTRRFGNQTPVIKNKLYDLILKALTHYQMDVSEDGRQEALMIQTLILNTKGLVKESMRRLAVAKREALAGEDYFSLIRIYSWETHPSMGGTKKLEKAHRNFLNAIDTLKTAIEYKFLESKLTNEINLRGAIRDPERQKKIKRIMDHPLLKDPEKASSFEASYRYHDSHASYYSVSGDFKKSHVHSALSLEVVVRFFSRSGKKIQRLFAPVITHLQRCIDLYDSSGFFETLKKGISLVEGKKALVRKNPSIQDFQIQLQSLEMQWWLVNGEFEKAENKARNLKWQLSKMKVVDSASILYYSFNLCLIRFGRGDLRGALEGLNILQDKADQLRHEDTSSFISIFRCILLFELEDYELLEPAVRSAYRSLRKKNRLFKMEKCILDFIGKDLPQISWGQDMRPLFSGLKQKLKEIAEDPLEKNFLEFFDILSWLESKITGEAFTETIRRKARKIRESFG